MSEKYILLECNRLRATQNYNNNEEQDVYKNRWVNNVNSYGIVINPGDTITCESSAINTVGASDSTIEFTGDVNKNGFTDNKCDITYAYYVCDAGFNLVKLPFANTSTYSNQTENVEIAGSTNLLNRALGEPYLFNFNMSNPIADVYSNDTEMPIGHLVMYYELDTTVAGTGSKYRVNGIYNTTLISPPPPGFSGLKFKVLAVDNEEGNAGIPSKIQMWHRGSGYPTSFQCSLSSAADGGTAPNSTTLQLVNVNSYVNQNFASKTSYGPDGRRYYFGDNNFTGSCLNVYNGIPNDATTRITTAKLNPQFNIRSVKINHEVPLGLNTPDNIGTILTDQMHRPDRYNLTSKTKYFDYSKYNVYSVNALDEDIIIKPPIIATPTYTPMPTNGRAATFPYENFNCLDGARLQYYSNVCYDDPARIGGLSVFRQFSYGLTNNVVTNQINSGVNQLPEMGDFENQTIGNLGLIPAMLMTLPGTTGGHQQVSVLNLGELILTNIYFTETNLQSISGGFRKAEKYWGSTNVSYDTSTANYTDNMAVALDLGLYNDGASTAYPLTTTDNPGLLKHLPNQRYRFKGAHEAFHEGLDPDETYFIKAVDIGAETNTTQTCIGSQPFGWQRHYDGNKYNDGQELSSLVITTNYRDSQVYNPSKDQHNSIFHNLHTHIIDQYTGDNTKFGHPETMTGDVWSVDQMFNSEYTDALDGITYNALTLQAMAKKYNLCVVPVWAYDNNTEWNKFGNRPYIAFRSHLALNGGTSYDTKLNGAANPWQIDSRNAVYGMQLGYDASYIRNNAAYLYNTEYSSKGAFDNALAYNNVVMMGAVNPNISFDENLSRFTISGLNTPMTIGNGLPTNNQENNDPNPNPEQQVYNVNTPGQIAMVDTKTNGTPITINGVFISAVGQLLLNEYVPQQPDSLIDSYGGLAIVGLTLYGTNNSQQDLSYNGLYGVNLFDKTEQQYYKFPRDILKDTLFGKMGFYIEQLMPEYGSSQSFFLNPLTFETSATTFFNKYVNSPLPQITGAYISSAEYQPTSTNRLDMPLYGMGTNGGLPSAPSVEQASIAAQDLPSKLDYPYLLIYSSIIAGGTDTEYYGGADGKSKLPCVGFITRNYNSGNFFYGLEQSFSYTATKTFILTEIETEIRLPDGTRPRLNTHNSVIYKITKPLIIYNNNILLNNKELNKKNNKDNNDKRRKDIAKRT
jgi:hypothetical protein